MFEENDTLTAEAASEEDKDGPRLKGWSGFCRVNGFANLQRARVSITTKRINVVAMVVKWV